MPFIISSSNVFDYLIKHQICHPQEQSLSKIELKPAKNFNLLISLADGRQLLVKQERHDRNGKTLGEFIDEWKIHDFCQQFPEIKHLQSSFSEVIHFDLENSIIIFNYLNQYQDLAEFYAKDQIFPVEISQLIGTTLATVHGLTINNKNYLYMAASNLGTEYNQDILRIYFNVSPEGALSVMENITTELNNLPVAFSFKALYTPDEYKRYDSAVLYFNKHEYKTIYPILQKVYLANQEIFSPQIPLFTKPLAPGLSCAEEPENKFGEKESFGTHRCQIIANGLIAAWQADQNDSESRMTAIFEQFALQKIKLQYPYLNTHSQDIYTPLDR
ncbi:MAG: T3SS effector HopA1 family protein [Dolichospermum sp.]